jgi:hypothetical protein
MAAVNPAMQSPQLGLSVMARLATAAQDWVKEGAIWVDLPWTAPEFFVECTRPAWSKTNFPTGHGHLVASGEQSFLWLDDRNELPSGRLIGWTPCFRDEPVFDRWHQFGFLKIETYQVLQEGEHPASALSELVNRAAAHFECWADHHVHQKFFRDGTADIELNGHEIGSYGIRKHPSLIGRSYLYGTVLAEPRFSTALSEKLA